MDEGEPGQSVYCPPPVNPTSVEGEPRQSVLLASSGFVKR